MEKPPSFKLTPKQDEAANLLISTALTRVMLYGGSRSGKTFELVYAVVTRALKAAGSRHGILRHRFNHIKQSVGLDTLPKVMALCYPGLSYHIDKTDWVVRLPNGSEIWLLGLDDKERTEKILGKEFATLYFNECSQISYKAVLIALTRLAQKTSLVNKAYFDCNPPGKSHWTYRLFIQKIDPVTKEPLRNKSRYGHIVMNPGDNLENLSSDYIETLESMPEAQRKRFLEGVFLDDTEGALWTIDGLDACRAEVPAEFKRIVIAVDPSGASGDADYRSDEIGIIASGIDFNDNGYVLEDATLRAHPDQWGRVAVNLYHKWEADKIVAERNYGGAMVESVIRTADRSAPVKLVTASRGKHVRAEPVASLYEQGRAKHCGRFPELEDQMCGFMVSGYMGEDSPDRADAMIWGMTELMLNDQSNTAIFLGARHR
ncbi:phage terminase large subunit [Litorimonas haliclonae]|uniref:phage terminase large subunit n=1 Tax=Litorimonas haliclonae TaxID=2081977 RepID=UPI0039EFE380